MAKVTEAYQARGDRPLIICDFSPPRGSGPEFLENARGLDADFISVAYNPGKSVRVDSAMLAYAIKEKAGRDVLFSLATRDMNRLAMESHLLGVSVLGLENLLIVGGDPFSERDLERVKDVSDFRPTELMKAVADMNQGLDYKGLKLREPTDLCIGGAIDLGRGIETEARLTHRKVQAGAQFFVTQPVFDTNEITRFLDAYQTVAGQSLAHPVFWGLQILVSGGIIFSSVPEGVRKELDAGRDGVDIALEQWAWFRDMGMDSVYLMPPILRGGVRDYEAAQRVLKALR